MILSSELSSMKIEASYSWKFLMKDLEIKDDKIIVRVQWLGVISQPLFLTLNS